MSRDPWTKQLRIGWGAADSELVEKALAGRVPVDALQHAGFALLAVERSDNLVAIARLLTEALGTRNWLGDAELIGELKHWIAGTTIGLKPLAVDLDNLAEALEQMPASEAMIDLATGIL